MQDLHTPTKKLTQEKYDATERVFAKLLQLFKEQKRQDYHKHLQTHMSRHQLSGFSHR